MPTKEELRVLFHYDANTGQLISLTDRHRVPKGTSVGRKIKEGYITCKLAGKWYSLHRLIWVWCYGAIPKGLLIDHINGNRADNRINNLRLVDSSTNRRNSRRPNNNTSGKLGIYWNKGRGRWSASITVFDKCIHLGYFDSFENAAAARKQAEKVHNFYPDHGRVVQ